MNVSIYEPVHEQYIMYYLFHRVSQGVYSLYIWSGHCEYNM